MGWRLFEFCAGKNMAIKMMSATGQTEVDNAGPE
jgi:hypothetical protein